MTRGTRRTTTIVSVLIGVLLAMAGTASANTGPGEHQWGGGGHPTCASGQARGQGGTLVNTFTFTVCRHGASPQDVSGYFAAAGNFGTSALIAPQGPVTCAEFSGSTVSFLYPLAQGSEPPFPANTTAILIVATAGGPGVGKIGFVGPAPTATFLNRCDLGSPQGILAGASQQPLTTGAITVTDHA